MKSLTSTPPLVACVAFSINCCSVKLVPYSAWSLALGCGLNLVPTELVVNAAAFVKALTFKALLVDKIVDSNPLSKPLVLLLDALLAVLVIVLLCSLELLLLLVEVFALDSELLLLLLEEFLVVLDSLVESLLDELSESLLELLSDCSELLSESLFELLSDLLSSLSDSDLVSDCSDLLLFRSEDESLLSEALSLFRSEDALLSSVLLFATSLVSLADAEPTTCDLAPTEVVAAWTLFVEKVNPAAPAPKIAANAPISLR
ncbi:hypothetical protein [Lactobacillus crispatus]|uniref:hypothetical protein n=1 Tax=Lactobacillus crispatus TaxID=47770 RepID=UPI0021B65BBE|nr:hypothetical protein [Lactobacillus crispatus]